MAYALSASHPDLLAPRFNGREFALWASAAIIIVSAHVGSVWALNQLRPEEQAAFEAAPVAVMIDLAPEVVAPNATPDEMVDLVESVETPMLETPPEEVEPTETPPLEPVPPLQVEQQPPLEPVEPLPVEVASIEPTPVEPVPLESAPVEPVPVEAVTQEPVEEVVPETLPEVLPEIALAVPVARPEVIEPLPEPKPQPKPVRKPPPKVERKPPPKPSVSRQVTAEQAPKAAAPRPTEGGASNGVSPARWQSRVNAHLNRFKPFPAGESAQGTASVRFTIDSSGRVLSASLSRSSGSGALDQAAVEMVRRASPVPAPPPAIAKARMTLNVPVRFSRR